MGSLRYLTHSRPNILFSVGFLSRFKENLNTEHLKYAKRLLRYLRGTIDFGLTYKKGIFFCLEGYSDSDYAGDLMDGKSTSSVLFFLGGNVVTRSSQKQRIVALSSCEAEYVTLTQAACQRVWLSDMINELIGDELKPVKICVENKSAIELAKNLAFHSRSKHIKVRYHYIRTCIEEGQVTLEYTSTTHQ
ncbi:unnamed protein product [Spirodela intermedia]|uniref:Uncharacterized protein n=1 Tax=Spirodela intermedia TaxID=51605 RepID=A0A7I8JZH9_SPIIN|nr:unnamed protein product [Spirodela intermedia]CAA7389262.1 unnamed protein product [Spirodela intermedia]